MRNVGLMLKMTEIFIPIKKLYKLLIDNDNATVIRMLELIDPEIEEE